MAWVGLPDMRPWGRRALTIPPDSRSAWIQLALWELWMGGMVAITTGFGGFFVRMAARRIITRVDLEACYGPPPVHIPCDRIVYVGGVLDAAFTALIGVVLIIAAAWFVWELWSAVEPKPLTDDFLKLLNDSFGRDWRNPLKWPWARLSYAYGFAIAGAAVTVTLAVTLSMAWASSVSPSSHSSRVTTSEGFRLGR